MTNPDKSYEVDNGFTVKDGPSITGGSSSPIGLDRPTSTIYIQTEATGIKIWRHFSTNVNDWQTINQEIYSTTLPSIVLSHNANISNNQLIGYTNLANNAVVVGSKSKLSKLTSVNANSIADYSLDFFNGVSDGGNNNGFFRHTVVNNSPLSATVTGSPIFNPGDRIGIYYRDEGQNAKDLNVVLLFEAIE